MLAAEQHSALQVAERNTLPAVAGRHRLLVVSQQRIAQGEVGSTHQEVTAQRIPLAEESTHIERVDLEPLLFWEGAYMYRFQVVAGKELFWEV